MVLAVLVVGPVFFFGMVVFPRIGQGAVDSAHHVDNGLILTVEKIGSNTGRSIMPRTERLRLVDPLTGEKKALTLCDEFPTYLGQAGALWFFDNGTRTLLAYDPRSLVPIAIPAQVPRLKSARFDAPTRLMWLTAVDGFNWTLDGKTSALTKAASENPPYSPGTRSRWGFTSGLTRNALIRPDGTKTQATFISPRLVGVLDDGPLVSSQDSLENNSNMLVARLTEDGAQRWSINLTEQDRVLLWWKTKDVLTLVTRGRHRVPDQLTTVSLADGKIIARYEY